MRYFFGLVLVIFLAGLGIFAMQNTNTITVRFWNWSATAPIAFLAVCVYLLGMVSGWSVIAFVRGSIKKVRSHSAEEPGR